MTAPSIMNRKDEAASRVLTAFINLLFDSLERDYPEATTRVKIRTLKHINDQGFDEGIHDTFHNGFKTRPVAVSGLALPERRCRDIMQLSYNAACEIVGPVDADSAFGNAIDAVERALVSKHYSIKNLL